MKNSTTQNTNLKITNVEITKLKSAIYNPRKWDDKAIKQLTESIKRFWLVDPIIVNSAKDRENIVIWWHFRISIAAKLWYKEIPVVYVNIPDIEKEKELNLRLNRNTWEWDLEILKDFDIDILLDVWFDETDLWKIWDDMLDAEDDNFNTEEELQKIKIPKAQKWDIFQLWRHRLICWDSINSEDISKLVWDNKISMLYCDPPYNINLDYNKWIGKKKWYWWTETNDNKTDKNYQKFIDETVKSWLKFCNKDCHIFYWCDENYIWLIQDTFKNNWLKNKRVCLWIKNNQNATPCIAFNKVYEPCVYAIRWNPYIAKWINNLNEIFNKEVSTWNRVIDDIYDMFNIWLCKRLPSSDYEHPTQKPPTLHEKALRRCTKTWDKVLDLFWWSGSTLIACEQLKRTCYLSEIDPIFCDLIIKRFEQYTKTKAVKISKTINQ